MSWSLVENNYYPVGAVDSGVDWISLFAILMSGASVIVAIRVIYLSKKVETEHQMFENLCLNPVKYELDDLLKSLQERKGNPIDEQIEFLQNWSDDFLTLLNRIKLIYERIDVLDIQDQFNAFVDYCANKEQNPLTETIIDEYQSTRVIILHRVYSYAQSDIHVLRIWRNKRNTPKPNNEEILNTDIDPDNLLAEEE